MAVVSILSGNIMHSSDYIKELEQKIEQLKRFVIDCDTDERLIKPTEILDLLNG